MDTINYKTLNCISPNTGKLLNLSQAQTVLGYQPQDNAKTLSRKFELDQP